MSLSIVIPLYNEEGNIPELYSRVKKAVLPYARHELVFVDDGSHDNSPAMLRRLAAADPAVKVLFLSRNFKQHASIAAGLKAASGEAVVLMDGDLQDVPEEIPRLVEALGTGLDIVYGVRVERADPWLKRMGSRLCLYLFQRVSGHRIPRGASTFRAMSRRFVDAFNALPERNRFTAGIMSWMGFPAGTVPIRHAPRARGRSRYDLAGYLRLFLDGIFSFSDLPLKIMGWMGAIFCVLSLVAFPLLAYARLAMAWPLGPGTTIPLSLFFLSGIHLICLAVLGQYIGRIFREVQERPLYLIKESLNF